MPKNRKIYAKGVRLRGEHDVIIHRTDDQTEYDF